MKRATHSLFWLAFFLVLAILLTPRVEAGGCRAVTVVRSYDYTPIVERVIEKVNYVNVARFVDVPLYNVFFNAYAPGVATYGYGAGVGYGYPQAPAVAAQTCEQKLSALELRLQKLEGGAGVPRTSPMPKAEDPQAALPGSLPTTFAAFAVQHCARCHDTKNAAAEGGGLTITNGNAIAQLSPQTVGNIIDRITTTDAKLVMPKGAPLPQALQIHGIRLIVSGK